MSKVTELEFRRRRTLDPVLLDEILEDALDALRLCELRIQSLEAAGRQTGRSAFSLSPRAGRPTLRLITTNEEGAA